MNRTQEYESSLYNYFEGIMSEQSDNDRANNAAAINELQFAAARIEVIIATDLVTTLKDISVEYGERVVAALKDIVVDIDEEIQERRDD